MSDGVESSAAQDAEKLDHAEAVTNNATSIAGRKRPRRPDGELASRSKRMFGLLNQTLTKAKEDNTRGSTGEVARKRAEIQARLQEKRKQDDEQLHETHGLAKRLRSQLAKAHEVALEMQSTEAVIRLRKSQKRRLGSFLITPSELSNYDGHIGESQTVDGRVLAPDIASVLAPIGRDHPFEVKRPDSHPIYYLPKKVLSIQDDKLDDQEDRVDDAIDKADKAWSESKLELRKRFDALMGDIDESCKEMARLESKSGHSNGQRRQEDDEMKDATPDKDHDLGDDSAKEKEVDADMPTDISAQADSKSKENHNTQKNSAQDSVEEMQEDTERENPSENDGTPAKSAEA